MGDTKMYDVVTPTRGDLDFDASRLHGSPRGVVESRSECVSRCMEGLRNVDKANRSFFARMANSRGIWKCGAFVLDVGYRYGRALKTPN